MLFYLDKQIVKVRGVSPEEGIVRHEEYYGSLVTKVREQWAKIAETIGCDKLD